jgi:hypothetical protein
MSCFPAKNLIINIGFGENATHTKGSNKDLVENHEINFPLKKNAFMVVDKKYDALMLLQPHTRRKLTHGLKRLMEFFLNIFRKEHD